MADFKTAEQYVVEKLETLEREREEIELQHNAEIMELKISLEAVKTELEDAYELLNRLRNFVHVRTNDYWGTIVNIEQIYSKEHPEVVARLMEYYDIRPDEEDE